MFEVCFDVFGLPFLLLGHTHIAEFMLKFEFDIDAAGEDGKTVLHLAAEKGEEGMNDDMIEGRNVIIIIIITIIIIIMKI